MKSHKETAVSTEAKPAESNDKRLLARRAIIKGAAGAVPTILSLQSGAALARSSNLIRSTNDATDDMGRTLCLSTRSVEAIYPNGQIDLGPEGYGQVWAIKDRDLYREPNRGSDPVSEEQWCLSGETVYVKNMGWYPMKLDGKGHLVSANSIKSFANINITEI